MRGIRKLAQSRVGIRKPGLDGTGIRKLRGGIRKLGGGIRKLGVQKVGVVFGNIRPIGRGIQKVAVVFGN